MLPEPCLAPRALRARRTHLRLRFPSTSDPPELLRSSGRLTPNPSNSTRTSFHPLVSHPCQSLVRPMCNRQVVNLPARLGFSSLPSRHVRTPVGVTFVTAVDLGRAWATQVAPSRPEPFTFNSVNSKQRPQISCIYISFLNSRSESAISLIFTTSINSKQRSIQVDPGRGPAIELLTGVDDLKVIFICPRLDRSPDFFDQTVATQVKSCLWNHAGYSATRQMRGRSGRYYLSRHSRCESRPPHMMSKAKSLKDLTWSIYISVIPRWSFQSDPSWTLYIFAPRTLCFHDAA